MADQPRKLEPAQDDDVEQQLDSLLAEIEQEEPGVIPRPAGAVDADRDGAAHAVDAAEPADGDGQAEDLVGFELASQIQELLDSGNEAAAAQAVSHDAAQAPSPTAGEAASAQADAAPGDKPIGDDLAKQIQTLLKHHKPTDDSAPAPTTAAPANPPLQAAAANPIVTTIEELDQVLAEDADDAIAGDFETAAEVVAAASEPVPTPAPRPASAPMPASASANAGDAEAQEEEPDLEGAFETPEELLSAQGNAAATPAAAPTSSKKPAAGFAADARSVAEELESQPERLAAAGATLAKAQAATADTRRRFPRPALRADGLKKICGLLNRPLAKASPQVRDMVGWVGLLTLFNATVALLAFSLGGGGTPANNEPPSHAAPTAQAAPAEAHASR